MFNLKICLLKSVELRRRIFYKLFISLNDQRILSVLAPHKLVEVESSDLLQTNHVILALFLRRLY